MKLGIVLLAILAACFWAPCQGATMTVSAVVRDFWPCTSPEWQLCGNNGLPANNKFSCNTTNCHADFQAYCCGGERGAIEQTLGPDRKPVLKSGSWTHFSSKQNFNMWFRDTPGVNIPMVVNLTFDNNVYAGSFNSEIFGYKNNDFFPINGKGYGNYYNGRNYHFTLELHSRFTYRGGEVFDFNGDDDLFVFINDKLVIDLGGVHPSQQASVNLDTLGLIKNANYPIDIFFAERRTTQSNFVAYTGIQFVCSRTDWCGVCEGDGQSCCRCNDNNICTRDYCDANNGTCLYERITSDSRCTNGVSCPTGSFYSLANSRCETCFASRNNCSYPRGTCSQSGCVCAAGWAGADCSQCASANNGETRLCRGTGDASNPYQLLSVPQASANTFLNEKRPGFYPCSHARPNWKPNDDNTAGTPSFDCNCQQLPQTPVTLPPGCSASAPYTLLTTRTSPLFPTQSSWIQLRFRGGCYEIPTFRVTVADLPVANFVFVNETQDWADVNFNNYTNAYVQYPSSRQFTELYDNAVLSANEEDFASFKLHLPQDTPNVYRDTSYLIKVDYRYRGIDYTATHTVVVPVVPSAGAFNLVDINPAGPLRLGTPQWFAFTFTGLQRLVDFRIAFKSIPGLGFTYPTNGDGSYSSLYIDNQLDVSETDFTAVRVVPSTGACGSQLSCSLATQYTISWLTAELGQTKRISETRTITFQLSNTANNNGKRDTADYELVTKTVGGVPVQAGTWVLLSFSGKSVISDLSLTVTPNDPAVTIAYLNPSAQKAQLASSILTTGQLSYVPVFVSATHSGSFELSLSVTYSKGGQITTRTEAVTLNVVNLDLTLQVATIDITSSKLTNLVLLPIEVDDIKKVDVSSLVLKSYATPSPGVTVKGLSAHQEGNDLFLLVQVVADTTSADDTAVEVPLSLQLEYSRQGVLTTQSVSLGLNVAQSVRSDDPNTSGTSDSNTSDIPIGPDDDSNHKSGQQTGAIIGGTIGGAIAGAGITASVAAFLVFRKKHQYVTKMP